MDSPCSLRPATADDLDRVLEIENHVHLAPWTREHFLAELDKTFSTFWVLTDDETDLEIAGYLVFWTVFEESQILNVVVAPEFRSQGYARKMIRRLVDVAMKRELKRVSLDVRKSNLPAIQLYQALEFNITHVHKAFYSNGEDAYQMTLFLAPDTPRF